MSLWSTKKDKKELNNVTNEVDTNAPVNLKENILKISMPTEEELRERDHIMQDALNAQHALVQDKEVDEDNIPDLTSEMEIDDGISECEIESVPPFTFHNSIYFYHLIYKNTRLSIDRFETGFLEMPVSDKYLSFATILSEIEIAKRAFVNSITQDFPGLQIESAEIKVMNIYRTIKCKSNE